MTQEKFTPSEPDSKLKKLVKKFSNIFKERAKLKRELDETEEKYYKLEEELYARLEEFGFQRITVDGETWNQRTDIYYGYLNTDFAKISKWLKEVDLDYLITQTVNRQSLTSQVKDLVKRKIEIPDFINKTTKNRVGHSGK